MSDTNGSVSVMHLPTSYSMSNYSPEDRAKVFKNLSLVDTARTYEISGGKYTAVQNPDGTWNILDVPIFGELPKGLKGNEKSIGRPWMDALVERSRTLLQRGKYWPPMHIDHHEPGVKTTRAGFFVPTRVGQTNCEGETVYAVFADLIMIPDDVFRKIEKSELPYRSVEVFDWDRPEFASLALMDDEAPFFRFPMLTIGDKVYNTISVAEKIDGKGPARAFVTTGKGKLILFKFEGPKKDDDKEEKPEETETPDEENPDRASAEAAPGEEKTPKPESGVPALSPEEPGEITQDFQSTVLQMLSQMSKTMNLMAKAFSGGIGLAATQPTEENMAPNDQPRGTDSADRDRKPEDDNKGVRKPVGQYNADTVAVAKLSGEVEVLKARDAERERKEQVRTLVSGAEAALKGYHITDGMRTKLNLFAEKGKELLDAFVESIKTGYPKETPASLEQFDGGAGAVTDPEMEKITEKFKGRSPAVQAEVLRLSGQYDELKARKMVSASRERFIDIQLAAAGRSLMPPKQREV